MSPVPVPGPGPGEAVTYSRIPPRRSTSRAATWWGRAWVRAVEEAAYADSDLHDARQLSRSGAIGAIAVGSGSCSAVVHQRSDAWSVTATVPVLDGVSRQTFVDLVTAESGHVAALVVGELPHRLVEQSEEAGVELLPYGGELGASCPCGSWVDPCVHALAVMLQVAWLVDGDPWVLLRLRGLAPEDVAHRAAAADRCADDGSAGGRGPGEGLGDLAVALDAAERAARVLALTDDPGAEIGHLL